MTVFEALETAIYAGIAFIAVVQFLRLISNILASRKRRGIQGFVTSHNDFEISLPAKNAGLSTYTLSTSSGKIDVQFGAKGTQAQRLTPTPDVTRPLVEERATAAREIV